MNCNLHTHTCWSDGEHAPEQLVAEAVAGRITHLGITDHFATSKLPIGAVVSYDNVWDYSLSIRRLADANKGRISVYLGLEIDFRRQATDLARLARSDKLGIPWDNVDYLLFEYVSEKKSGGESLDLLAEMRQAFPCPVGLCHNNLTETFRRLGPERLAETLRKNDIFIELYATPESLTPETHGKYRFNVHPSPLSTPYYRLQGDFNAIFYRLVAEMGIGLSAGNDTHRMTRVDLAIQDAMDFLSERRLESNLIIPRLDARRAAISSAHPASQ